jgi:hypothetical protein
MSSLNYLKLEFIEKLIDSPIFSSTKCCDILLGVVCRHINNELEKNEKVRSFLNVFFKDYTAQQKKDFADHDCVLGFFPAGQDFEIIGLLSVKNGLYCNKISDLGS